MNELYDDKKNTNERLLLIYTFLLALVSDSTLKTTGNLREKGTGRG